MVAVPQILNHEGYWGYVKVRGPPSAVTEVFMYMAERHQDASIFRLSKISVVDRPFIYTICRQLAL